MTTRYEMRFKTSDKYPWKVFDTYRTKDDPELIKHYKNYSKSKIIKEVEVIEVITTRNKITI